MRLIILAIFVARISATAQVSNGSAQPKAVPEPEIRRALLPNSPESEDSNIPKATLVNPEPVGKNVPKATLANLPQSEEPEIRRAILANEAQQDVIPVRRAIAVPPQATSTGTTDPELQSRPSISFQKPETTESSAESGATPESPQGSTLMELQTSAGQQHPLISQEQIFWGLVAFVGVFTVAAVIFCLHTGRFFYLNNWDVALACMVPGMLIATLKVPPESDLIWRFIFPVLLTLSVIGSLFTGWKTTGSIGIMLLLFIPKIVTIFAAIVLGVLSILFAFAAAHSMKDRKTKEAVNSAGKAAASGVGFVFLKNLIDRLTRDTD